MEEIDNIIKPSNGKNPQRDKNGKFCAGNTAAIGNKHISKTMLLDAIAKVEKKRRLPFLEKLVEMAYRNPQVMIAIIKKFIPDISLTELTGAGGSPLTFIIEKTYQKDDKG